MEGKKAVAARLEKPQDFNRVIPKSPGIKSVSCVQDEGCVGALEQFLGSAKYHQFGTLDIRLHYIDPRNFVLTYEDVHRGDPDIFLANHLAVGMGRMTQCIQGILPAGIDLQNALAGRVAKSDLRNIDAGK